MQSAIGARGFGEGEGESEEQVLVLVHELVADFDVEKKSGRVELVGGARLFVLASLKQVGAVAGTIECDLALLAATLRADAGVDGGAESFFFADVADGTGHESIMALASAISPRSHGDTEFFQVIL